MGLFSFLSKDKKETLDKGLQKTKESLLGRITRAIAGKSKVDDDLLDELEETLVTSDVGVDTTLRIIERLQKRVAEQKYINTAELNGILKDEISQLLVQGQYEMAVVYASGYNSDSTPSLGTSICRGCGL